MGVQSTTMPLMFLRKSSLLICLFSSSGLSTSYVINSPPVPRVDDTFNDQTKLGNLVVPSVGVGTISWSSGKPNSVAYMELQSLVNEACHSNAAFFDSAERYGSNWKTAFGLGWGETEKLTRQLLQNQQQNQQSAIDKTEAPAIIATKFTPSPWRATVDSVVSACEESRLRLGVEQIDLYQLHMPDVFASGTNQRKDEIYWGGLAACYNAGLVKNVGVCNYGSTLTLRCQEALAKKGVPLASNQIAYSLVGRHNGSQRTVDTCNDIGIKVLAFFPFAMGLLTGKYNSMTSQNKSQTPSGETELLDSLISSKKTVMERRDLQAYATKFAPPAEYHGAHCFGTKQDCFAGGTQLDHLPRRDTHPRRPHQNTTCR